MKSKLKEIIVQSCTSLTNVTIIKVLITNRRAVNLARHNRSHGPELLNMELTLISISDHPIG